MMIYLSQCTRVSIVRTRVVNQLQLKNMHAEIPAFGFCGFPGNLFPPWPGILLLPFDPALLAEYEPGSFTRFQTTIFISFSFELIISVSCGSRQRFRKEAEELLKCWDGRHIFHVSGILRLVLKKGACCFRPASKSILTKPLGRGLGVNMA